MSETPIKSKNEGIQLTSTGDIVIPNCLVGKLLEALINSRFTSSSNDDVVTSTPNAPICGTKSGSQVLARNPLQPCKKFRTIKSNGVERNVEVLDVVVPTVEELQLESVVNVNCPVAGCEKVLNNTAALQMHYAKVHGKEFGERTDIESYAAATGINLSNDFSKRSGKQIFFCPVENCNRNMASNNHFTRRNFVKMHYQRQHMEKAIGCSFCHLKFATKHESKRHERVCGVKHVCDCGASYNSRQALIMHAKRNHHTIPDRDTRQLSVVPTGETIQDPQLQEHSNRRHVYQYADAVIAQCEPESLGHTTVAISNGIPSSSLFTAVQESRHLQWGPMTARSLSFPSQTEIIPENQILGAKLAKIPKSMETQKIVYSAKLNQCSSKGVDNSGTSIRFQTSPKLINSIRTEGGQLNASPVSSSSLSLIAEQANTSESQKSAIRTKKTVSKKSPIYYVNFGETQTEVPFIPLMSGQGTQTSFGPELNSSAVKESKKDKKLVNSSTAIQTRCSINPSGRRNDPNAKSKKSSSCQTNANRRQAKRSLNCASVQTDIPKKRKRFSVEPVAEAESQTTPDKVTSCCSVDLQTNLSFEAPCQNTSLTLTESNAQNFQVLDRYTYHSEIPAAIQTETQTLPFDLTDFFDADFSSATTTELISPTVQPAYTSATSEAGSFVSPQRSDNRVHDEIAVETQTPWPDIFANDLNSDQNYVNSHWLDPTPPVYVTLSEGTQTVELPDDLASIDFSLL